MTADPHLLLSAAGVQLPEAWAQALADAGAHLDPDLAWPFEPQRDLPVRHKIVPDLWPLAVPLDTLKGLPGNPRQGNVQAMRRSLATYGLRKPVVVNIEHDSRPVVEAGNHTLKAAKAEGWTHLAVVRVRDDPDTELGFALADNRVGELGRFDPALLAEATGRLRAADPALLWAAGYTGDERPGATDPRNEWQGMPEYEVENQKPAYRLMVHFPTMEDVASFFDLIGRERPRSAGGTAAPGSGIPGDTGMGHGVPQLWWPEHDRRGQFSDEAYQVIDPGDGDDPNP